MCIGCGRSGGEWAGSISDEAGYMFEVFDTEGVYIAEIHLKSRPRLFKNDRMYTVEEDEDGFHVVKRYRIGWNLQ
jgi:hypothetical protein